ncbi:MAG: transcriptional repressor [Oscillospiraceae bacterium]
MMKYSRQREMIYEQVMNFPIHPTADEVYYALKDENPNLSIGTVYRNLNLLSDMGMLMKINIANGKDRFDGRTDRHYHMTCTHCGKVFDVELDFEEEITKKILSNEGHTITGVTLNLSGICRSCSESLAADSNEAI